MDSITRTPELNRSLRGHAFYPPQKIRHRIPALYTTDDTPAEEKTIYAHYFAAWGDWLIAELDWSTGEAFGWARIGGNQTGEWGYIDLPALESFRSERGLPNLVERDLYFDPAPAREILTRLG